MKRLRAILVDDEQLALTRLRHTLDEVGGVEVVAATTRAREALAMIGDVRPDLVFLDIAMPGLTGFDIVERLAGDTMPAVIFVTAFDSHAVRAFGVDAVDYLLKPVAPDRLAMAIGRARTWLSGRAIHAGPGPDPAPDSQAPIESLWTHRHREVLRVRIDDIEWVEAHGDYVRLHTNDGRGGLVRMTLSALEVQLDDALFIRVHRSAICRRTAIAGLRRKTTGALAAAMASGVEAPVGRKFSGGLRQLIKRVDTPTASETGFP
ncbi:response regulator transcription factor [Sphingomonas sp. So64.6b]|uniref:LytR/AlgR family response regulator transcription factor n=1 Tax=Sphingomonas sp. So64.6b TaxID=2997354 RepID=UPI001604095C|nr:LytTR family DNA-binding domain-containing protein [Sphingomonas sp. So64.6b]QNA85295.1 response regulator transcription factor [Sphingomonas sp. So64.6b]